MTALPSLSVEHIHERPDYNHHTDTSAFPCGLPGGSPVRVAWAGQTVTCPGCIAARRPEFGPAAGAEHVESSDDEVMGGLVADAREHRTEQALREVVEHDGSHPDCALCRLNGYWERRT